MEGTSQWAQQTRERVGPSQNVSSELQGGKTNVKMLKIHFMHWKHNVLKIEAHSVMFVLQLFVNVRIFSPYFKIMITEKMSMKTQCTEDKSITFYCPLETYLFSSVLLAVPFSVVKWGAFSAQKLSYWWICFLNLLVFCLFTYFCCCCCKRRLHWPVYHLLLWGIRGTWTYRRWQMTAGQVCNPGPQCCPVKRTETKWKHLFLIDQIEERVYVHRADSYSV